jgi:hypothetical protein
MQLFGNERSQIISPEIQFSKGQEYQSREREVAYKCIKTLGFCLGYDVASASNIPAKLRDGVDENF